MRDTIGRPDLSVFRIRDEGDEATYSMTEGDTPSVMASEFNPTGSAEVTPLARALGRVINCHQYEVEMLDRSRREVRIPPNGLSFES